MEGVKLVELSENDLFQLDEYVDIQLAENRSFKEDGVLHFKVTSGPGTPLHTFMRKYKEDVKESLVRLNPTFVPQSEGCYGHVSTSTQYLTPEELSICSDIGKKANYVVSNDNCCVSALNEGGTAGLLSHYFVDVLHSQATNPPQCKCSIAIENDSSDSNNDLVEMKNSLKSQTSNAKKKEILRKALLSKKPEDGDGTAKRTQVYCTCWMCSYSDEVLIEVDGEIVPQPAKTAEYFQGKGFFYANGISVTTEHMISSNFSLSFINDTTLTCLLDGPYQGINNPYLYFGFQHSFFPIHVEDMALFSVNFVHHGYFKTWIIVPPSYVAKLIFFLSQEYNCPGHGTCINLLGHKYYIPTPSWLERKGIPFKVVSLPKESVLRCIFMHFVKKILNAQVVQRSSEGIIVAPNAAHFGFNCGANVAEAVNFASKKWVPYGIVYPKCTCMPGQVHADLSLIIKNYCPEMMEAYRHRNIPAVPEDPDFLKCIVHPNLWRESFENDHSDIDIASFQQEAHKDGPPCLILKGPKKRPNRKVIMCPVCEKVYTGGQKERLMEHLTKNHKNLAEEEEKKVQAALAIMFPDRGSKLPKIMCEKCNKFVANLRAHKKTSACTPEV